MAARRGDRAAFEELVRCTARGVYARVYLEVGDAHAAEDLVQETYLRAWRGIGKLQGTGFRTWLNAIAHSVVVDAARHGVRKKRVATRQALADVELRKENGPEEMAAGVEERERALALLRNLPAEYREVVAMRYLLGADYEAIGRTLGLSNGSLRGLLNRGMVMLRERWKHSEF